MCIYWKITKAQRDVKEGATYPQGYGEGPGSGCEVTAHRLTIDTSPNIQ